MSAGGVRIIRLVVSALLVIGLAACGGSNTESPEGVTTLQVWDQFSDESTKAASQQIYRAFEATHPDVKIVSETYLYQDMGRLAKTALASGTGPDVLYYDAGRGEAGALAESKLILPLTDFNERFKWTERLNPQILSWSTYSGVLYGLGLESEVNGIFANKTLFSKERLTQPTTYAELLDFCKAATAKGLVPIAYGQGPAINAKDVYALVMNNILGPEAIKEQYLRSTSGRFDSPESVKALEMWFSEMDGAGCFAEGVNGVSIESALRMFQSRKALMLAAGTWWVNDLATSMDDDEITFNPFPEIENGPGRYYPAGVGSAWIISSETESPEAAAEFVDFIFSVESVKTWIETGGLVPPIEASLDGLDLGELQVSTTRLIQTGVDGSGNKTGYYIWPVWSGKLNDSFMGWAQSITSGQETAAEVAARMQEQWKKDNAGR